MESTTWMCQSRSAPRHESGHKDVSWSLRDVLVTKNAKSKPFFRVIAKVEGGAILAIIATGAMYKLLFDYGVEAGEVQRAMSSWSDHTYANAAMDTRNMTW